GTGVVEARRLIDGSASDVDRRCRGRKVIFGTHPSGDWRAVRIDRNRQRDPDAGRYVAFPAAPGEGVALPFQKSVAGLLLLAADIEERQVLVAAIDGFIKKRPVALGQIDGFENGNPHRILDHAAGIARRAREVLDDGIERIARIDLAISGSVELLVSSD